MKDADRKLIRDFYQSIPTPEDKARFQKILSMDRNMRMAALSKLTGNTLLPEGVSDAIMSATTLTKEDRIMIFSGALRQWIYTFLTNLGL